jgi:hypothetical protein
MKPTYGKNVRSTRAPLSEKKLNVEWWTIAGDQRETRKQKAKAKKTLRKQFRFNENETTRKLAEDYLKNR